MDKKDYKNVFVFAEQREGVIQPVALELLGKARDLADALGEKVVAMLLGEGIKDQAQMLIEYGADEVIVVDAPELKDFHVLPLQKVYEYDLETAAGQTYQFAVVK